MASPKKLLFVCSRNRWRSPTAEKVFHGVNGIHARSAGTEPRARIKVTAGHIVLCNLFDFGNARHIDLGFLANPGAGPARNLPATLKRSAGLQLHFQPDFILVLKVPDGTHPRTGVSINHLFLVIRRS